VVEPKTKKRRKRQDDHLVMGGKGMRCLNCGTETPIPYPVTVRVMKAHEQDFRDGHLRCKPSDKGRARYKYNSPEEWLESWDTGVSAMAIYATFQGHSLVGLLGHQLYDEPVPRDPADFGRCYRLLKVSPPAWTARIEQVAKKHPAWKPFADRWPELVALYEEELPTGECPKLYALMKEIRG
jgi:hypothetical protein